MTDFLYAKPSFLGGLARLFDFSGFMNTYNDSPNEEMADYLAMKSDWEAVGSDMWKAIQQFESEYVEKAKAAA